MSRGGLNVMIRKPAPHPCIFSAATECFIRAIKQRAPASANLPPFRLFDFERMRFGQFRRVTRFDAFYTLCKYGFVRSSGLGGVCCGVMGFVTFSNVCKSVCVLSEFDFARDLFLKFGRNETVLWAWN